MIKENKDVYISAIIAFTACVFFACMTIMSWKEYDVKRQMHLDKITIEHDKERPRRLWEKEPKKEASK